MLGLLTLCMHIAYTIVTGFKGGRPMNEMVAQKAAPVSRVKRDISINIRIPKTVRDLIDTAANVLGKTRSDFILESARKHAIDVLLDQRFFSLDADQFAHLISVLDAPPAPNEKLKKLFA